MPLFFIAGLLAITLAAEPAAAETEKADYPAITISHETTRVTRHLREDGLPDYAAALNEHYGQGVTPENNANALFWRAMGPHPEGATLDPAYFEHLGMEPPPEEGDYYINLGRYLTEQIKLDLQSDVARAVLDNDPSRTADEPWGSGDYPLLAGWLAANEKPLALLTAGTKRPRYYSPVVVPEGDENIGLFGVLLPHAQQQREFSRILRSRAMLHLGEGRPEAAWDDLLTCHRLGRHGGQGMWIIEWLVGIAVESVAAEGARALVAHAPPDRALAARYLADLESLPAPARLLDKIDYSERYSLLAAIVILSRGKLEAADLLDDEGELKAFLEAAAEHDVDWNEALRTANGWYDQLVAAAEEPERGTRRDRLEAVQESLAQATQGLRDGRALQRRLKKAENPSAEAGRAVGSVLTRVLATSYLAASNAEGRREQQLRNLKLAIALAAWRREHDSYPDRLEQLRPDYLQEVPLDAFSGEPLHYVPARDGYLLYSVGPNGEDDGGRSYGDIPRGDDISAAVPLARGR